MFLKRAVKAVLLIFVMLMIKCLWNSILNDTHNQNTPTVQSEEVAGIPKPFVKMSHISFSEIKDLPLGDPRIIEYLRRYVLIPPSKLPYVFTKEMGSLYKEQVKQMFGTKSNGFFIECGANDGEYLSNTLELEMRGWKGLLIEAQPELGKMLMTKNRKAWFANVCLSPYSNISEIEFAVGRFMNARYKNAIGKLLLPDNSYMGTLYRKYGKVPCFPITTIMAALGVTHVDYLSLDVEGVELKILNTLPFDGTLVIDLLLIS
ncbi:unnamed protein product [Allacma fusca]|uniref:Methyltransferase FkbM domain-containing protein n=1 Tax=Allacma fusca TaxID=39272 RepID=A0A8J2PJ22_9HEXA|nr:unnamed protein product [Allacma fusca]